MGHVNPALSVHQALCGEPGYECLFLGSRHPAERKAVENEGVPFVGLFSGKLRRYFSFRNVTDIPLIALGFLQSLCILLRYRPDVLFSKGGYVSVPAVAAAHIARIPVVTHESDAAPGLATKINSRWAKKVCVAFREAAEGLPPEKVVVTGNPIRRELLVPPRFDVKRKLGTERPLLLVLGGSQGSRQINRMIWDNLDELTSCCFVCHQCGEAEWKPLNKAGYVCMPYIGDEINELYQAADLVVSRSGAGTVGEICHYGKASLLVPLSLSSSRGDQILNAERLERKGAAVVLHDDADFLKIVRSLLEDEEKRSKLGEEARALATDDAAVKIADVIKACMKR
jgi:UDP-N-acetylglucosamine--N-acetylmuramyl-(pentapeptide) pyrophosphoryl-undecaprenol N-acetylglucosamine transferase